ncbi:helix-turn-helix domain-containing protein [Alicyclobacillus tolerans]|uniref:helix-turn-helix domain-containing protein n=1 Tax=Alicyclobacillus tolerans TaxID=90970 RepID=UPI0035581ECE|nr:helix-turn-helix domain-containing protein [Alicyclobacillus tolerans]
MFHLKTKDLCEWLGISERTVRYYRQKKALPFEKGLNGTSIQYVLEDVKTWLHQHSELHVCVNPQFEKRWKQHELSLAKDARHIKTLIM